MPLKQMRFKVTSKLIRPNSWITQTGRQRIPNCWARNGESTSTQSAATDAWNDELTASGGSQMLATRNRGDRHAVIGEVPRGSPYQTTVDHHRQLVLHPLRNILGRGGYCFTRRLFVCLFVCLSACLCLNVSRITEKSCRRNMMKFLEWSRVCSSRFTTRDDACPFHAPALRPTS